MLILSRTALTGVRDTPSLRRTHLIPDSENPMTVAEKYIAMAEGLERLIALKRRPRLTNTPKRALQDKSARIEADHLERAREVCLALAKQESSDWIGALTPIYTKTQILKMMKTKVDHPSYYSLVDTGVFTDTSPEAVKLQRLVEASKDPAAAAEKARQDRIAELIEKVKFSNIPGFFPTPKDVVDVLIDKAQMPMTPVRVLEPSAGIGSIADKIDKMHKLKCFEIVPVLCDVLQAKGYDTSHHDFLTAPYAAEFDRIVMNPPFENGQDAKHVRRAYDMLTAGGRLVSIMSTGPFHRSDRKSVEFREWLDETVVNYEKHDMPAKAFETMDAFRKTGVNCVILVIEK